MNQREVRAQSRLEQEGLAAELHPLLALLDNCPDACPCRKPNPAGT
jgi:hypothetical protein